MPVVRTVYRPAVDTHDELSLSLGGTLSYPVRDDTDAVVEATVSGSSVLVLDAAGTTLITKSTITNSATLTATVAISASDMANAGMTYGYNYRTRWTLVLGSDTVVFENMLGVVRTVFPYSPIRVADLTSLHHGIDTLIAGSGQTLGGEGGWIDRAWQRCIRWMRTQENRPSALISPADVKDLAIAWTLELIFLDLSTGRDESHWQTLFEHYRDERQAMQGSLQFVADVDQDGAIDDENRTGHAAIYLSRTGGTSYGVC